MTALLSHWLHLTAAAVWAGTAFAAALVVWPALGPEPEAGARLELRRAVGAGLALLHWACWTVLLLTGVHKLRGLGVSPRFFLSPFGALLGVKLCLAGALAAASFLGARRFPGRAQAALAVLILLCAAGLRTHPW